MALASKICLCTPFQHTLCQPQPRPQTLNSCLKFLVSSAGGSFNAEPSTISTGRMRVIVSPAAVVATEKSSQYTAEEEEEAEGRENNGTTGLPMPMPMPMGLSEERKYELVSVKDYMDRSRDFVGGGNGRGSDSACPSPPRWFCPVECKGPPKDAPVLFFLPGMDGVGLGLILHHQTLAELFEIRCLHIPVTDRTPFEGLVKYVEKAVRLEHKVSPLKPIYLVGDSLGGCLALAVAAHNPTIDLVLILANPSTSFNRSQLQPFLPQLEAMPEALHGTVPYLLSFVMGDPVRMAMANVNDELPLFETVQELSSNLQALLPKLSNLADIVPKDTLLWKLKLLRSAALYANSRLHAVKAEVLLLASGKDQMLPTREEALHLSNKISNCRVRYFRDSGHTLLLEDGLNLATLIKSTNLYRHSRNIDYVSDYFPPTLQEFKEVYDRKNGWFRQAMSPVLFSTLADGKIVKGLLGIPQHGPVLLVGYHMLMGLELTPLVGEFLKQRNILVRGIAHPYLFSKQSEEGLHETNHIDSVRLFGAVPVSAKNLFKLLSTKSFVLLYPGGAREALHRKGEQYQLFWPERSEFVRMAARFGTTIIPFAAVGEDDLAEIVLDYNDQKKIPYIREWIEQQNQDIQNIRSDTTGEVSNQELHLPVVAPKLPGRLYYLFGKPIATAGREVELKDKEKAHSLYLHIKSEIEAATSYLLEKRKEDPYRQFLPRFLYEASWEFKCQAPTFDP